MRTSRKILLLVLVAGIGIFAYSQYVAAYLIDVKVMESSLIEEVENGSTYSVQLEFNNPSLLILNAGITDFEIQVDKQKIADGVLEPFVLPAMGSVVVNGQYFKEKNSDSNSKESSDVIISGITKYDILFTSLNVPFIYFPTEEQSREFINQK
jgi:hypothetical protein